MECNFCAEFATIGDQSSPRVITEMDGWVVLPTLGCFTPGYCLLMPTRHIDAVADTSQDELSRIADIAEEVRTVIGSTFGPTIVAEHGPRDCELGASCCSHAHLHFIPVPDPDAVTAAYESIGSRGRALSGMTDLPSVVDEAYMYLSPRANEHLYWPAKGYSRQFVRRVCAAEYGIGAHFDWRDHPFEENQGTTFSILRQEFTRRPLSHSA
jgi:diadenosine tetraphosphate (Ap4A) HIT family hydrolase